jgi:CRP-like cAMP-binding protein
MKGETLIRDGDPSNFFYVMLEGQLRITKFFGEQEIFLATGLPGRFFGEIQILLDVPHFVLIRAVADCRFFRLPRAGFWDLLRTSPPVAREIMRTLATRLRNMEGYTQEREKLIQLGAMAAGLAHELNNPATAARRAAADLRQNVERVQDYACELNETLSAEQWQQLVAISQQAVHCAKSQPKLNSLEQNDREEAIQGWLDSHKVADAWDLAPALVNARVDQEELEALKRAVPAQDLENAIRWLAANLTTRDLLKSITHSTERISALVRAMKSYSFMDQAAWQEVDVHEGIENTLIILGRKLRNITVNRDFDRTLPRLSAYGGELNQVWTKVHLGIERQHTRGGVAAARLTGAARPSSRSRLCLAPSEGRDGETFTGSGSQQIGSGPLSARGPARNPRMSCRAAATRAMRSFTLLISITV